MSTTEQEAPGEYFSQLQSRKTLLEQQLRDVEIRRGDARLALSRAVAFRLASAEETDELRSEFARLDREHDELTGALTVIAAEIAALLPIVNQAETQRLIEVAAEKRAVLREAASKLRPMVEAFAKEYAPVLEAAHVARMEAVEAETAARRAQGLPREEIYASVSDVGFPSCGNHNLDQGLASIAIPTAVNPNLPEEIRPSESLGFDGPEGSESQQEVTIHGATGHPWGNHAV